MSIDALPDAPSPIDSVAAFDTKAFNFLAALQAFRSQANDLADDMQANADTAAALLLSMALPQYAGTSTTSLVVGTGAKSFTTQTGKGWTPGQVVIASSGANSMKGTVTAYSGSILDVDVTTIVGSGTFATWAIGVSYTTLVLAESGANSSITSLLGLTTPLSRAQGGTGDATGYSLVPVGAICGFPFNSPPPGYLKANGALVSRTTYADLFAAMIKSATATISQATPGVVTWTAHGRSANDVVRFSTTGSLPTGLTTATDYYVVGASITANTFTLSAAPGGAAINTSSAGSGVHTAIHAPFGVGDGSTTFALPDFRGEFMRGWDDGRGVDSNRAFGSAQGDLLEDHTHYIARRTNSAGNYGYYPGNVDVGDTSSGLVATGGVAGTETRPRNVAPLVCIKF